MCRLPNKRLQIVQTSVEPWLTVLKYIQVRKTRDSCNLISYALSFDFGRICLEQPVSFRHYGEATAHANN